MTYIPHLIANWATGFDRELQPWLLPVDAQTVLLDGFVYRGVWQKRDGYDGYANGDRGGSPLTESRMVYRIANAAMTGAINSSNTTYTITATTPVRRGTFSVTSSNPSQTLVDNGVGGFTGPGTGTINYTTGAVSVTFTSAPTSGTVVANYDVHQGFPVMGVMTFYTATNVKQLIVADTTYVNIYNPATNRLDDISPSYPLTGTPSNFFTWTNYDAPNATPRLLFVNDKDEIQRYNGTTVSPFPVFLNTGPPVTGATFFTPTTISPGPYTWATPVPVLPSTVSIKEATDSKVVTDDGFGNLVGDGSGTIDYLTGVATVTFNSGLTAGQTITIDYTPLINPIDTALHIFQMKDRLIILGPTVGGVFQGKTILISGTGRFGDIFATQAVAPGGSEVFISGSGLIDISDDSFIDSADFNRDDLIVFTENSTWAFKYTGNDAVPFELNKLDNSRGTQAPYGTISYLNLTTGESPRGFIACDGYSLERTDNKIPRFSFDEINLDEFILCNAGKVDEDRDHYLIYPSPGKLVSDRILITNYEEYNYSIYRLPLSCMGNFFTTEDVTWDDLAEFDSWEEMAIKYSTWDSFIFQAATPIGIGGGHKGEIFSLNEAQSEDYPVLIRNITGTNSNAITLKLAGLALQRSSLCSNETANGR